MCSHWLVLFTRTDTFLPSQSLLRHISTSVVPLIHLISQSCYTTHHMFHVTRSFSRGFKRTLFIPPSYTSSAESTLQTNPTTITSPIHTYWSFLVLNLSCYVLTVIQTVRTSSASAAEEILHWYKNRFVHETFLYLFYYLFPSNLFVIFVYALKDSSLSLSSIMHISITPHASVQQSGRV